MKSALKIWLVVICGLFVPAAAYAQAQASITGVVKDTSGAVVPGVTVEASSPALIEKSRTVTSDGAGQYRIIDLRPGTYSVTFSLAGFSTLKREGIELSGSFTATVNAELRVGTVGETLTVTAESPLVDLQSAKKETVLNKEVIDAIPSGRTIATLGVLIPGVVNAFAGGSFIAGSQDVGGSRGADYSQMSVHGSRGDDMMYTLNGNASQDTVSREFLANLAAFQEVTFETAAMSAEEATGGIRVNLIPRDGGNTFSATAFATYSNDQLQANNLTDDLKARGLPFTGGEKVGYDINPGLGGPLMRDKLWFFGSGRLLQLNNYAGIAINRNAGFTITAPQSFLYNPDPSAGRPVQTNRWTDLSGQLTWQAAPKHKLSFGIHSRTASNDGALDGSVNGGLLISQDAGLYENRPLMRTITADWTSPVNNRILLEAHFYTERFQGYYVMEPDVNPQMPVINDQGFGVKYGAFSVNNITWNANDIRYRGSMSYVTGTQAFKIGAQNATGYLNLDQVPRLNPLTYTLNKGAALSITEDAGPLNIDIDRDAQLGIYAQDKWTASSRLTLSGAIRYDWYKTSFPATPVGPGLLFPTRNLTLPAGPNVSWKDLTYRSSAVYDPFGKGKTAIRVSLNKYLNQPVSGLTGSYGLSNGFALVASGPRSWNDANGNKLPDCVLTNFAANGECGALTVPNFGQIVPGGNVDPNVRSGFGVRPYNWEFSAGVQQQVFSRVSVNVGFYRRWYGNFTVARNTAYTAANFDTFSITLPTDSRLPNSGGTLNGLVNLKPEFFTLPANVVTVSTDSLGANQIEHWNGVDTSVTTRLSELTLGAGTSTGRISTDNCEVIAIAPDTQIAAGIMTPTQFCHVVGSLLTQVKAFGSYTIPHALLQMSVSFQSIPGPAVSGPYVATNAITSPSLGRSLTGGAAAVTVQIVPPNQLYGERLNQLDLRFGRLIQYQRLRVTPSVDVFNVTNGNAVTTENPSYGLFRTPVQINQGRLVKFSLNMTF